MPLKISDLFSFSSASRKPSQLVISGPVELMNPGTPRTVAARHLSRKSISEASRKKSNERRRQSISRSRHHYPLYQNEKIHHNKSTSNERPCFTKCHAPRRSSLPSIYHVRKNSLARPAAITKSHSHGQSGRQGSAARIQVYQDHTRNDSVIAAMIAEIHLDLKEPGIAEASPVTITAHAPRLLTAQSQNLQGFEPSGVAPDIFFGDYEIKETHHITETNLRIHEDLISPITPLPSPLPPHIIASSLEQPRLSGEEGLKRKASSGRQYLGEEHANTNAKLVKARTPSDWDSRFSWSSMTEISIGIEAADYQTVTDRNSKTISTESMEVAEDLFPLADENRISMTWKMLWVKSQTSPSPTLTSSHHGDLAGLSRGSETSSQFSRSSSESSKSDSGSNSSSSNNCINLESTFSEIENHHKTSSETSQVENIGNGLKGSSISVSSRHLDGAEFAKLERTFQRRSSSWVLKTIHVPQSRRVVSSAYDTYDIDNIIASYT